MEQAANESSRDDDGRMDFRPGTEQFNAHTISRPGTTTAAGTSAPGRKAESRFSYRDDGARQPGLPPRGGEQNPGSRPGTTTTAFGPPPRGGEQNTGSRTGTATTAWASAPGRRAESRFSYRDDEPSPPPRHGSRERVSVASSAGSQLETPTPATGRDAPRPGRSPSGPISALQPQRRAGSSVFGAVRRPKRLRPTGAEATPTDPTTQICAASFPSKEPARARAFQLPQPRSPRERGHSSFANP